MDVQLQELVDKIRKDGIESAEIDAAAIVKEAEEKARGIIEAAQAEAEIIIRKGNDEARRAETAAVSAMRQAARNLMIAFRDGIVAELDALVRIETETAYDASMMKDLIPHAVQAWISSSGTDDIAVILSPADAEKLLSGFQSKLKSEIARGLVVRADASVQAGFRIGMKDGSAFYDFSADAVAELFASYLNPRVSEVLRSAAREI
jgi:V/A-type H+-transporting ATPase subunit E